MASEEDQALISEPIDLSYQVYVEGADYQLLCCGPSGGGSSGGGGSTDPYSLPILPGSATMWVTAAELVYELTGNPGKVVKDLIIFDLDQGERVEIRLLGGDFRIMRDDQLVYSGRKAFELLMRLKGLTFEDALKWIAGKYSTEQAATVAYDYLRMRVAALNVLDQT